MSHNRRPLQPRSSHVSPVTKSRRSIERIIGKKKRKVKQLRDLDWTYEEIAEAMRASVPQIADALGNSRAGNPASPYASIFTRKPTKARFLRHALPGESAHETLVRVLDEYEGLLKLLAGRNRSEAFVPSPVQ